MQNKNNVKSEKRGIDASTSAQRILPLRSRKRKRKRTHYRKSEIESVPSEAKFSEVFNTSDGWFKSISALLIQSNA